MVAAKVQDCGLGSRPGVTASGTLRWTFTTTGGSGCPGILTLTVERSYDFTATVPGGTVHVISTRVTISYPYAWQFGNVITLLAPGANYAKGVSQITGSRLCLTWIEEAPSCPQPFTRRPSPQSGQTLVLVSICLVVLIAMAALAIDLTTLYVARREMQRAADAAALAGAKALVNSGVTTSPATANLRTLAQNMANGVVSGLLPQNTVGGVAPTLVGGTPTITFTRGHGR